MRQLLKKIETRTATREEYVQYSWNKRFTKRRQAGIDNFWRQERKRLLTGKTPTRQWTSKQKAAILRNERPKIAGRSFQSHHTYSASKYPHLSNRGEIIYPATFSEHLYNWHGGNFKNSLPGKPIKKINDHTRGEEKMIDTLSLIITSDNLPARCFSIIRKYNPISIGEIKKRVSSNLPILEYDALDHDGLNSLLKCYSELNALDISVAFLDSGEPTSLELMYNLQKSYAETEAEISLLIDEESK